jgi:hypothetical protein
VICVWLTVSYNVTRSLEGYEASGMIRAEEGTDRRRDSSGCNVNEVGDYS